MKVIYIAGPYRDERGEWWVRQNIRKAELYAEKVWVNGGVALCPHKNTAGFGGLYDCEDETWLKGDLELLKRCDAMWAIAGWELSRGATEEVQYARRIGIPVLFTLNEIIKFIREGKNA